MAGQSRPLNWLVNGNWGDNAVTPWGNVPAARSTDQGMAHPDRADPAGQPPSSHRRDDTVQKCQHAPYPFFTARRAACPVSRSITPQVTDSSAMARHPGTIPARACLPLVEPEPATARTRVPLLASGEGQDGGGGIAKAPPWRFPAKSDRHWILRDGEKACPCAGRSGYRFSLPVTRPPRRQWRMVFLSNIILLWSRSGDSVSAGPALADC